MQKSSINCEVLVVGDGLFAMITAAMLQGSGVKTVLVLTKKIENCEVFRLPPVLWPSMSDPPTRAHVAHGMEVAQYLSDFCQQGQKSLLKLGWTQDLCLEIPSLRFAREPFEQIELQKACDLGLSLKKSSSTKHDFLDSYSALVLLDREKLVDKLMILYRSFGGLLYFGTPLKLQEKKASVDIEMVCAETNSKCLYSAEIAVLDIGHRTGELLPEFKEISVPVLDKFYIYQGFNNHPNQAWRAAFGHWSALQFADKIWVSGPRFMLPLAGVGLLELTHRERHEKAQTEFHRQTLFPQLSFQGDSLLSTFESLDCWPCDELPVIGELGRWGRVLGAFGWYSVSHSAGPLCAEMITELIMSGRCDSLHPRLQKTRLLPD